MFCLPKTAWPPTCRPGARRNSGPSCRRHGDVAVSGGLANNNQTKERQAKRMSIATAMPPTVASLRRNQTLRFHARDVTGTHEMDVEGVPRGTPSGVVAQSLAARMELPTNVPWSLRNDRTGAWLKDDQASRIVAMSFCEPRSW